MQSYTKIYMKFFDYGIEDFIPCEVCGKIATEIHHIIPRSQDKSLLNEITNCMAICRTCHLDYGDKKQYKDHLQKTHNDFIKIHSLLKR